jgi:hypothetical protein
LLLQDQQIGIYQLTRQGTAAVLPDWTKFWAISFGMGRIFVASKSPNYLSEIFFE